ncbi:hypothetical protein H4R18_002846 [Coemansia javaensis]|uniref:ABC transporter domain-containing protein n=1 Tax=Coemansia javaensis TaxID=2761396 RepID=A0A9W8LI53_9FUNG|nr:hypothetical protein H4R18_002846 [Coemansia javaensis]
MEGEGTAIRCDTFRAARSPGGPGDATAAMGSAQQSPDPLSPSSKAVSISIYDGPGAAGALPGRGAETPGPLQSEPILQWSDLSYEVGSVVGKGAGARTVLDQISGDLRAGEMVAIIGSSGAGKTTLLNALSGRIVGGKLSGAVLFRGARRDPGSFKRLTAYVQQDDIMHTRLTVLETLAYSSKLRLSDAEYTPEQKIERATEIMRRLRLEAAQNTQIGDANTRGVSGGERKRVSIGTELLTNPNILFLDEPTSGLDSNSSQVVVDLVKQVARDQRMSALMTIHQPSARIFNTFDRVIMLSQGRLVYFGPPVAAIDYFAGLGYRCPMHENPADYFIDLMTIDYTSEQALAESRARVASMAHTFAQHSHKRAELDAAAARLPIAAPAPGPDLDAAHAAAAPRNGWLFEYWTLQHREWVNVLRNMEYLVSQAFQSICMALIVGFMFFYLKHDAISVQNRLGVLYTIALNATFPVIMPALYGYLQERDIMLRERAAATYRVTAFYVAKFTTLLPIALVSGAVFITGVYFISHLVFDVGKFFIALGIYACLNVVAVGFTLMVGSGVKNIDVGFVAAPAIVTIWLLFGGLLANPASTTPVLRWLRWVNPVYFAFSALLQNELRGMAFECDTAVQCYRTGDQVIKVYSVGRFSIWGNALFLIMHAVAYFVAGYVLLRWKIKPRYIWI